MVGRPCSRNVRKLASTVRKLREMEAGILLASSICPSYSFGNPKPWDGAVCIQGEPSLLIESPLEMPPLLYPKVCVLCDAKPVQLDHLCWQQLWIQYDVKGRTFRSAPIWYLFRTSCGGRDYARWAIVGVSTFKYAQDMLTKRSSLPERNDPSGLNGHLSMSSSEFSYVKEEKLF